MPFPSFSCLCHFKSSLSHWNVKQTKITSTAEVFFEKKVLLSQMLAKQDQSWDMESKPLASWLGTEDHLSGVPKFEVFLDIKGEGQSGRNYPSYSLRGGRRSQRSRARPSITEPKEKK